MASKHKGLGRGLDSLISFTSLDAESGDRLNTVPIHQIRPGRYQPRVQMNDEALQELSESIRAQGVIQPIVVRQLTNTEYELIAGERRWRAAQIAGLSDIPVVIKNANDQAAMAMGLIENIQRENLNPIEEAQGFKRLIDEFELTHETVAEAVGRSRSAITNSLRLLKLPAPIQDLLFQRQLEMGHARAIINLSTEEQLDLANKAAKNGWSVREMEKRSQQLTEKTSTQHPPKQSNFNHFNEQLKNELGIHTEIKTHDGQKGKIILHFDSSDCFYDILERLGVHGER